MTQQLAPVAVRSDEGEARWWFASLTVIRATGADTGGQMTIVEITEPPGSEAPLHVHHREDEGFWILEGSATFQVGDATIEASAGDYLFGPRDTWANDPKMNFHDRTAVEALLDGLEIVDLQEQDSDGDAVTGPKHWHVLEFVARQPG